jgi:hypothetical protein
MQMIRPVLVLAALATAAPAAAQLPASPQSLGMGGAHMGVARGQEALLLNPAQLGLRGTPHWSVAFPQVVLGGTFLGIRYGDVGDIRNYDRLSDDERRALLARVPRSGTEARYDLNAPVAAFQFSRFAVGWGYRTAGGQGISYDLAELALVGYEPGRRDFDVRGTVADRAGYTTFSAATGHAVGPVSLGVTGHLYRGGTLVRSRLLDVEVDLLGLHYQSRYVSLRSEGGTGYGIDLGAAMQPLPGLTVSAALGNAIGEMNWNPELRQRAVDITRDDVEARRFEGLRTRFNRSDAPYGGSADPLVQEMEAGIFDGAELPRTLRLGAAYEPLAGTEVGAAYETARNESRMAGLWHQRLSVGVQHRVGLARLRAGAASNLDDGGLLSAGAAIGPIQLGLARVTGAAVEDHDRTGWVASFGLATRSNSELR